MKSLILEKIIEYGDKWGEQFAVNFPDISVTKEDNFAIFNYGINANFHNPIVQEARGIIIDFVKKEVVCWPFRKFGKHFEHYADDIDWSTAKVQEKLDGSIIKLWYNKYKNEWQFSSNGVIDAKNAILLDCNISIHQLIMLALEENSGLDFDTLDKGFTYIFELTCPENRIVVSYEGHKLWAIGMRNNKTGEEFEPNIQNISRPKTYDISSLDKCIDALDDGTICGSDGSGFEGFVVVDARWNRIKIKSPIYMVLHGIVDYNKHAIGILIDLIYNNKIDLEEVCKDYPKLCHIIKWYDYQLSEVLYRIRTLIDIAHKMVKIYNNDMRIIGKLLSNEKYSSLAFKSIKTGMTFEQIMESVNTSWLAKQIKPYPKLNRSYLFKYNEEETVIK